MNLRIKFKIQNIKSKHKTKVNAYHISPKRKLLKIKNRERKSPLSTKKQRI